MLPAFFAVFGDLGTGGHSSWMHSWSNLIKSGWVGQLAAGNEVRDLFPRADLPWYQSATGEGLLRHGFSVDRGYFGGHHRVGRVGGFFPPSPHPPISHHAKTR